MSKHRLSHHTLALLPLREKVDRRRANAKAARRMRGHHLNEWRGPSSVAPTRDTFSLKGRRAMSNI
jgi:hypothetical protein